MRAEVSLCPARGVLGPGEHYVRAACPAEPTARVGLQRRGGRVVRKDGVDSTPERARFALHACAPGGPQSGSGPEPGPGPGPVPGVSSHRDSLCPPSCQSLAGGREFLSSLLTEGNSFLHSPRTEQVAGAGLQEERGGAGAEQEAGVGRWQHLGSGFCWKRCQQRKMHNLNLCVYGKIVRLILSYFCVLLML